MADKDDNIQIFIRSVPRVTELSLRAHILLVGYFLYQSGLSDFSPTKLKNAFLKARLPYPIDKINDTLKELTRGDKASLISNKKDAYTLSIYGDEEIKTYLKNKPQIETGIEPLKNILLKLPDGSQKTFLTEAVSCAETKSFRASIVMTWLFVMDRLQDYTLTKKKTDFNTAMMKRSDAKKLKSINTKDDFADLKEKTFIEILRSGSIITKGAKKILDAKLDVRNDCAHPSDLIIKESTVIEFVETLLANIVDKYK